MDHEPKLWSFTVGEPGLNRVRVFEESRTRIIYLEHDEMDADGKKRRPRRSLGHRDRAKAELEAKTTSATLLLERNAAPVSPPALRVLSNPTLGQLFDMYLGQETPHKGVSKEGHDDRAAGMFLRAFGIDRDAATLSLGEWKRFVRERQAGEIIPESRSWQVRTAGRPDVLPDLALWHALRPSTVGRHVGDRQVEYDLKFLWSVLNWAESGDSNGVRWLAQHPLRGIVKSRHWPREFSPARRGMTAEQYQALLEVAESVDPLFLVALILAHETGHRIGSIRQLRWSDIRDGWIHWRRENDKIGTEHHTPLTGDAREVLAKARRLSAGIGESFIFPSPGDPSRPCSRHLVRDWFERARKLAGLAGVRRLGWHSLRRMFATDLRHLPLKDLAALGGWNDVTTIIVCYQGVDDAAMVDALSSRQRTYGAPARLRA